ncbi:MAG: hypothetical protein QM657_14985 [Lacrimispora sp.]|uniref:hypothetical protein n=1 Tax=Lacrimispora sp. TaxID=2719234 RepID=UPI0039E34939
METNVKDLLAELTESAVQVDHIEKVNLLRANAQMIPQDEDTRIILSYDDVNDGPFLLRQAPPDDCLTVRRAVLDILGQIDLQKLCTNLEASAALIDVAYNACNGIGGAHENLYQLRTDVYDAVVDSVDMSGRFSKSSNNAVRALLSVYETLSSVDNCDIDNVRTYLSYVTGAAKGMAEKADEMARRFVELEKRTLNEGKNIVVLEGTNIKQREELQKQLADFKAQLDAFHASKGEIEKQIKHARELYAKYDMEAQELNSKADTLEIVSVVVGGIGQIAGCVSTAVAGYYGSTVPKININPAQNQQQTTPQTPSQTTPQNPGSTASLPRPAANTGTSAPTREDTADVAARKTQLGSNKAELALIEARLPDYAVKLEALEKEKQSPDKKRQDSDIDAEIASVKNRQSEDSKRKLFLESQIGTDESYLNAKLASALGTTVAEASKELEKKFDNIGNNARSAAAAKDKLAQEMLRMQFELEAKNTENLTRIAEFTQRIKNGNIDVIDTSTIINSLQLAVTCLSTVGSTLATVSLFWKTLEAACANLADNDTIETLKNTINSKEGNLESLVKYATTNKTFGRKWFIMECQWHALYLVCNGYHASCTQAKNILDHSLRRAETDRYKHWQLAQQMAESLEAKLNVTLRCAQSKDEAFKKRMEYAKQERDKMLLDALPV